MEDSDIEDDEYELDTEMGSFFENYKSLTPKQIEGLNSDTNDLINTKNNS